MPRKRTRDQIENVRSTVQSVDRALALLECLAEVHDEMAIRDLSAQVKLHGSTVHRLLTALMARGFVRQNPETGRYSLGLTAMRVGGAVQYQRDLRREARPYLEQLAQESRETANLVTLVEGEAVYIEQVAGPRAVRMFALPGARVPVHCTGAGKVLLAALPAEQRAQVLARHGLPQFTPNTITTREQLEAELVCVSGHGHAIDDQEREWGVRCVAAPVRDARGGVVAAVSISGPSDRFTPDRLARLVPLVQQAADGISERMGYLAAAAGDGRRQETTGHRSSTIGAAAAALAAGAGGGD